MSESTFLIKSYFHSRKSGKITSLIGQVEEVARMVSGALGADLVAVMFCKPDYEDLVPLAFADQGGSPITDLSELELHWKEAGRNGKVISREYVDCTKGDAFATQNNFKVRLTCPSYEGNQLRSMILAYWHSESGQPPLDTQKSVFLDSALKLIAEIMTGTEEMRILTDYSFRLSELIAMFEIPVSDYRLEDLVAEISSCVRKAAPGCQYSLLIESESNAEFRIETGTGSASDHARLLGRIKGELADFVTEVEQMDTNRGAWKDITSATGGSYGYIYLTPLFFDNSVKYALVVWSESNETLTQNDRELLSVYSLFSQLIMKDALLLRNLTRANKLLQKSSRQLADLESLAALADMTSGVAHDFNNMIGGVVGRIQLMKLKIKDAAVITDLNKIESQVLEGAETIRRIQEFTTSAKNKKLAKVNLLGTMRDYFANPSLKWKETSQPKNVSVSIKSYVDDAIVEGAREDITLVIEKLVENAVEYARNDSMVEVVLAEEKKYYTLSVTNKGPIIPDNIRKKIFYPFFTTKGSHGSGMGLAIVHGIIVRHGGKADLMSDEVNGTTFKLYIPKLNTSEEDSDVTRKSGKLGSLKILVVDDDEQIREVLSDMLTIDGHQITACEDGYVALRQCQENRFDLMITDLGMPGMSGLDLASQVHESDPAMPIAMITGWGTQLDQGEVALKGVKAILAKPFHLKDIKALISELVVET